MELLYFDAGAFWQRGSKNLAAVPREQGIAQSVEDVKVGDEADASRLRFPGWPSFVIIVAAVVRGTGGLLPQWYVQYSQQDSKGYL